MRLLPVFFVLALFFQCANKAEAFTLCNELINSPFGDIARVEDNGWPSFSGYSISQTPKYLIYPNPVKDLLKVKFIDSPDHDPDIRIFNLLGQQQNAVEIRRMNEVAEVDLKALNKGTYILQFKDLDGSIKTQRITKIN